MGIVRLKASVVELKQAILIVLYESLHLEVEFCDYRLESLELEFSQDVELMDVAEDLNQLAASFGESFKLAEDQLGV